MESFNIVGKNRKSVDALEKTLLRLGFEFRKYKPDMIISLGGDGTYLYSERKYPGIPKLLVRDSDICTKCSNLEFDRLFMKIRLKNYVLMENIKLQAVFRRKRHIAANDVVIRNRHPIQAVRFEVSIDGKTMGLVIGDGIVVSTPFGSTGYHYSITKKKFSEGIGLAFNNPTKPVRNRLLDENSVVRIKLIRHDAYLVFDNDPGILTMKEGEKVTVRKSRMIARIIKVT